MLIRIQCHFSASQQSPREFAITHEGKTGIVRSNLQAINGLLLAPVRSRQPKLLQFVVEFLPAFFAAAQRALAGKEILLLAADDSLRTPHFRLPFSVTFLVPDLLPFVNRWLQPSRMESAQVSDWLIQRTPELCIESAGFKVPCRSGLQFACRYVADPERDTVFEYVPETMSASISNIETFAACLLLDKWTCNADGRQAVFTRPSQYRGFRAWFIDQGYCFNAGEWSFPDMPLRGVYYRNYVYRHVTGWNNFEPALSLAEQSEMYQLWQCAWQMPKEWFDGEDRLCRLLETLHKRRSMIRDLITQFREHERNPFPNWKHTAQVAVPALPADALECRA